MNHPGGKGPHGGQPGPMGHGGPGPQGPHGGQPGPKGPHGGPGHH